MLVVMVDNFQGHAAQVGQGQFALAAESRQGKQCRFRIDLRAGDAYVSDQDFLSVSRRLDRPCSTRISELVLVGRDGCSRSICWFSDPALGAVCASATLHTTRPIGSKAPENINFTRFTFSTNT
jgi:hypothetical protein